MDLVSTTQLLGNVGEFIGGITVLATLVYLAYQTRQGTRALERAEVRATMETFDRFFTSMQDPKTAALWLEGQAGDLKRPSAEHWSYTSLMVRYVYAMQNLWSSSREKIVAKQNWKSQATSFAAMISTRGGAECWERIKVTLAKEFVNEVEDLRSTDA